MTRAAPATLPTTTPTGNWRAREIILELSAQVFVSQLTDANWYGRRSGSLPVG